METDMNERIKELSLQASDSIPDDVSAEHAMYLFQKKFAELIVAECAEVARQADINGCNIGNYAWENIKQHFGI
jgi:hypothetical protein